MNYLTSLADLFTLMDRGARLGDEQARVALLCDHIVHDPALMAPGENVDPFSAEYRAWVLDCHRRISGRESYQPARDEQIPIDPVKRARRPGIYSDGNSHHLGTFLEAFGQILQTANVSPGARVLEYGPGDGQLSLALARMGCDVTVIDIEPKYLETIAIQARAIDAPITTVHGDFSTAPPGAKFDLVLFFESFHHAIEHQALMQNLHDIVADNGRILFAGEPIVPTDGYWAPVIPFPWGLRLDALSLSAVKNYGWMELGYQEAYFLELLRRTGWSAEKRDSQTNGRASGFVATRLAP